MNPQAAALRVLATPQGGWHASGRPFVVPFP